MSNNHEKLQQVRELLTRQILAGERPGPDEMLLMSDPYKEVWEKHDNPPLDDLIGPIHAEDWADVLDPPKG